VPTYATHYAAFASLLRRINCIDCHFARAGTGGDKGWAVADVGCGTGKVAEKLKERRVKLLGPCCGCDLSPRILKVCRKKRLYGRLDVADAASFLTTCATLRRKPGAAGRSGSTVCATALAFGKGKAKVKAKGKGQVVVRPGKGKAPAVKVETCVNAVVAADVLVYIGELTAFFQASAEVLLPGGLLLVSRTRHGRLHFPSVFVNRSTNPARGY
jgi:SAM-dependent methyltransferase